MLSSVMPLCFVRFSTKISSCVKNSRMRSHAPSGTPLSYSISSCARRLTICVILADVVVAAQDPGLNPALIGAAVARHLPEIAPDFVRVRRKEVYDAEMNVFR